MKSTVGYIIGLIAGILGIISSILTFLQYRFFLKMGMFGFNIFGIDPRILILFSVFWTLILSIIIIFASIKMNQNDDKIVKKAGIITLICGILAFQILAIIAGVIGIVQSNQKSKSKKVVKKLVKKK